MRYLLLIALSFLLLFSGCGAGSGGGTYRYHYESPNGAVVDTRVDSVRVFGRAKVHFSANGTADVIVEEVRPGPNNLGQALGIIENFMETGAKAGKMVAVP